MRSLRSFLPTSTPARLVLAGVAVVVMVVAFRFLRRRGEAPAVSADELARTVMGFDRNGDGRLTRDELPERFQGMFDRADTNKDGVLTFEELRALAAAQGANALSGNDGRGRRR
jgi:Ca2+-binding EF-hand superfamily protein